MPWRCTCARRGVSGGEGPNVGAGGNGRSLATGGVRETRGSSRPNSCLTQPGGLPVLGFTAHLKRLYDGGERGSPEDSPKTGFRDVPGALFLHPGLHPLRPFIPTVQHAHLELLVALRAIRV